MTARSHPLHAQDKLAFLLSLVPYLMDHDRVSVDEVAAHFDVEPDLIRSAVKLIAVSGVPGETSSYQPDDLFDIDWDSFEERDEIALTHMVAIDEAPRFSAREAAALIAGLQYLSALPENADRDVIGSLMSKLSRGASASPSQVAVSETAQDATLRSIREAVGAGTQVRFDYVDSTGTHQARTVDPLRLESLDQDWYLRAWCHLREAVRTFRVDRMTQVTVSDAPITRRAGEIILPDSLFSSSADDLHVVLEVPRAALSLIEDYMPEGAATSSEVDGMIRATVRVAHFHGLKRLISGHPQTLRVVSPPDAVQAVADWALAGVARYEEG